MTLIYEHNGKHWSILFLMFLLKVFTGNTDRNIVVCRKLNKPIRARYVRVHPIAWHGHISMRVELFGCNYTSCKAWLILKWQDGKSLFVFALRNWMIDWLIDSLLWASTIVDFAFSATLLKKKRKEKKDNIKLCILAIRVFYRYIHVIQGFFSFQLFIWIHKQITNHTAWKRPLWWRTCRNLAE